jgi:hypothetical protein
MNSYTVFAYILPDGGHLVETVTAQSDTEAAMQLREKLRLTIRQFEVIAVAQGEIKFVTVDEKLVALAPYSTALPNEGN